MIEIMLPELKILSLKKLRIWLNTVSVYGTDSPTMTPKRSPLTKSEENGTVSLVWLKSLIIVTGPNTRVELLLSSTDLIQPHQYPPITSQPTPLTKITLTSGKIWNSQEKLTTQNGTGSISATHWPDRKPLPMSISAKLSKFKLFHGLTLLTLIHQNHSNSSMVHADNNTRVSMVSSLMLEWESINLPIKMTRNHSQNTSRAQFMTLKFSSQFTLKLN